MFGISASHVRLLLGTVSACGVRPCLHQTFIEGRSCGHAMRSGQLPTAVTEGCTGSSDTFTSRAAPEKFIGNPSAGRLKRTGSRFECVGLRAGQERPTQSQRPRRVPVSSRLGSGAVTDHERSRSTVHQKRATACPIKAASSRALAYDRRCRETSFWCADRRHSNIDAALGRTSSWSPFVEEKWLSTHNHCNPATGVTPQGRP